MSRRGRVHDQEAWALQGPAVRDLAARQAAEGLLGKKREKKNETDGRGAVYCPISNSCLQAWQTLPQSPAAPPPPPIPGFASGRGNHN